jgi:hypothetical protein
MSIFNRGHSIDASCHVLVNLAKRFQRRFFLNVLWEAFFDPSDSYFLFAEERGIISEH